MISVRSRPTLHLFENARHVFDCREDGLVSLLEALSHYLRESTVTEEPPALAVSCVHPVVPWKEVSRAAEESAEREEEKEKERKGKRREKERTGRDEAGGEQKDLSASEK
eukprot:6172314-Pleurochrysis_carterae.AAC.1